MVSAIDYITTEGPKYGYFLNKLKGTYLMGKCDSSMLHPDNVNADDNVSSILKFGMDIFGSYIGTKEFIDSKLTQHLNAIEEVKTNLILYPHAQEKCLLLRYCFCPKITHLLRTINPSITLNLCENFELMKNEIFRSVLQVDNELTQLTLSQIRLRIQDGGCGLGFMDDIRKSAFSASIITAYDSIKSSFPTITLNACNFFKSFRDIVDELNNYNNKINLTSIFSLMSKKERTPGSTLQSFLTDIFSDLRINNFEESITDSKFMAWWKSLQNSSAGLWLDAIPKSKKLSLQSDEFSVALHYRLFLKQPIVIAGLKCSCSNAFVDSFGQHITTGCKTGGFRIRNHDTLKLEINNLLNYAGLRTIKEEKDCFKRTNPESGLRADISILNPPNQDKKMLLDIMVTNPIPGSQSGFQNLNNNLTLEQAKQKQRQGLVAFNIKNNKYLQIYADNGLGFLPIVFESTGMVFDRSLKFFKKVAKYAAMEKRIPDERIFNYMMTSLSVVFQKCFAQTIIDKTFEINGKNSEGNRFEFSYAHISSFHKMHL
jgi:hypothetical protein